MLLRPTSLRARQNRASAPPQSVASFSPRSGAACRGDPAECLCLRWIHQQSKVISNLSNACQLERLAPLICYDLETSARTPPATGPLASAASRLPSDGSWGTLSRLTNLTRFDDCVSQNFWICLGAKQSHVIPSPDFTTEKLHRDLTDGLLPFGPFVNHDFNALPSSESRIF